MRKIIASIFVSVDGYMVGPGEDMSWVMNNFTPELGAYAGDLMNSMDTILIGRVTYEIMTRVWPYQSEASSPGADKMNQTPKIVLSKTLEKATWGNFEPPRVLKENIEQELLKLKQQPGKNIVIYGSANVVQNLTLLGLIDEYQLLVFPLLLGSGKLLFKPTQQRINLKLSRTQEFENGVVVLYYEPMKKPGN